MAPRNDELMGLGGRIRKNIPFQCWRSGCRKLTLSIVTADSGHLPLLKKAPLKESNLFPHSESKTNILVEGKEIHRIKRCTVLQGGRRQLCQGSGKPKLGREKVARAGVQREGRGDSRASTSLKVGGLLRKNLRAGRLTWRVPTTESSPVHMLERGERKEKDSIRGNKTI